MPSFSTSLSCHARIHDLVGHLVWRLQVLHEKVHLGSAHIDIVDMVNSLAGLLQPIFPTLVGRNVVQGWLVQAMEETLNDQPFFHAVVGACCNVLLESLPSFRDGFIRALLKSGDLAPEGICLAHREVLGQEYIGTGIPNGEVCFVGVEPRLCFAEQT